MAEVTSVTSHQQYLGSESSSTSGLDFCIQTTGFCVSSRLSLVCPISHDGQSVRNYLISSSSSAVLTVPPRQQPQPRLTDGPLKQQRSGSGRMWSFIWFILAKVKSTAHPHIGGFSHFDELVLFSELCGHVKLPDSPVSFVASLRAEQLIPLWIISTPAFITLIFTNKQNHCSSVVVNLPLWLTANKAEEMENRRVQYAQGYHISWVTTSNFL